MEEVSVLAEAQEYTSITKIETPASREIARFLRGERQIWGREKKN